MVEDVSKLNKLGITPGATGEASVAQKNQQVSKDEFLKLLITQLKNQDPLEPKDNSEFAVDLAQFTQVEQLTNISKALEGGSGGASSLASYLGYEVELIGSAASIVDGNGGGLTVSLPQGVQSLTVEALNGDGQVVGSKSFGALAAGDQALRLDGMNVPDGQYELRVKAITTSGVAIEPTFSRSGLVTGFIPGADPRLLVNGEEVSPDAIRKVSLPKVSDTE